MLKRLFPLVAVVVLLLWPLTAGSDEPVVRLLLFYSESCPHCQAILNDYLPGVREKYGAQLEVQLVEISDPANFQKMLAFEAAYGVTEERAGIPEVFVGDQVLIGEEEVRARLEELIDRYLAQGGVELPDLETGGASASTQPAPATPTIHMAYFFKAGCQECARANYNL
ncbi:MAG TPA: hypothetical protein EYP49_04265, partial [Anaerolineae bacterium]|nr:hypothetical protein [Anaerolineae bacterium]